MFKIIYQISNEAPLPYLKKFHKNLTAKDCAQLFLAVRMGGIKFLAVCMGGMKDLYSDNCL